MFISKLSRTGFALALLFLSPLSNAHGLHQAATSFASGFFHPWSGVDHVLAMLLVGIWSANTSGRARLSPIVFMLTLFLGAMLGDGPVASQSLEFMVAGSLVGLGLMVWKIKTDAWASHGVGFFTIAAFGLVHGWVHGIELQTSLHQEALMGMILSSACLHAMGWIVAKKWFPLFPQARFYVGAASMSLGGVLMSLVS